MMRYSVIALIMSVWGLISCGNGSQNNVPVQEVTSTNYVNVSVTDLQQVGMPVDGVIILDVRTDAEVAEGMVPGAIQINVNSDSFTNEVSQLDRDATIYVYCRSGGRSVRASEELVSLGFTDVRNVEGGYMAWQKAGY